MPWRATHTHARRRTIGVGEQDEVRIRLVLVHLDDALVGGHLQVGELRTCSGGERGGGEEVRVTNDAI